MSETMGWAFDAISWGNAIARARRDEQLTQVEVAAILDVSPQSVSCWERGGGTLLMANYLNACHLFDLHPGKYFVKVKQFEDVTF